jgi:proteasome lid subunit RPN8/RPN11
MDPHAQIAAMSAMHQCGETMLGIYHSHPTTPALPSPRDLAEAAYPGVAYVIISLCEPTAPQIAAFVFARGRFEPLSLAITGPA